MGFHGIPGISWICGLFQAASTGAHQDGPETTSFLDVGKRGWGRIFQW